MNFTASKKDLVRLVGRAVGAVDRKSPMPILSNVLLSAGEDGTLTVSATDLYIAVVGSCKVDVLISGSIAVPAKDLFDRLRVLQDGPVTISVIRGNQIGVKSSGNARRFTLHGLPSEQFPPLPQMDEVDTLSLDAGVLAGLLRSTTYAVSTDETRAHLNSLCIEWDKEQIRAVGTDGHRLAYAQAAVRCPVIRQALVPLKAIVELKKMVDEVEVPKGTSPQITMHIGKANAFFEVCGAIMIAKLVDAQYPNYKYVIPKYEDKGATVPRQPMIDAVKAVALAASDRAGGVAVSLNRNGLAISVDSSDKGGGEDEVPMEYNGPSVTIGFHAKYLTDTLSAIEGDEVVMRVGGELDPILFTPQVETDINVKSVVMPMRLG